MTIAETHGKLTPYEGMEDLLTSDVFSAFKYSPPAEGLIPFLSQGRCFDNSGGKPDFLEKIVNMKYYFWPRSNFLHREPDLIIILKTSDHRTIAIDVEAKYMSGKHNIDAENDDEISMGKMSGDQLYDQYFELKNKNYSGPLGEELKSITDLHIFYITAHYVPPYDDINETIRTCRDKGDDEALQTFYWLNWRSAYTHCKNSSSVVLKDLADLLGRKRLYELSPWNWTMPEIRYPNVFFERSSFWTNIELLKLVSIQSYLLPEVKLFYNE
jgi:hypothetical protein